MRRLASIATAIVAASVTGCGASAGGDAASRPIAPITAPGAPAAPSVVASGCSTWMSAPELVAGLVHIRTTLQVRHAHAPQAGVRAERRARWLGTWRDQRPGRPGPEAACTGAAAGPSTVGLPCQEPKWNWIE